jgi:hypothetical protein
MERLRAFLAKRKEKEEKTGKLIRQSDGLPDTADTTAI